ncbi:amino acid adenylation domain-containing protein [Olivibacter sp. CPCC 100613]|uniref:non-ribosomal peptide synthetase n=1 Tax=Olivibacter sp. CPCC 100613 TaxID=3079931 RepID=UPI002FFBE493
MEHLINESVETSGTVLDHFLEHQFRDDIFIYSGKDSITFRNLHLKSNQLAAKLKSKGITRNTAVPVILPTGIDLVTAIVALFKIGAAYVPIDIDFPKKRIQYILDDQDSTIIISNKGCVPDALLSHAEVIYIENEPLENKPLENNLVLSEYAVDRPKLKDLAYIIYTSGSSGGPKGVMLEHSQLIQYCKAIYVRFQFNRCNSFAVLSTLAADAGNTALFCALAFGKNLLLCDLRKQTSLKDLKTELEDKDIDCYKITPSLLDLFSNDSCFQRLLPKKCLIIGGENLSFSLAKKTFSNLPLGCSMYNHYGPTETTIGVITYKFTKDSFKHADVVPIGHPLSGTQLFIRNMDSLDHDRNVKVGELLIGGPQVCRGYYKRDKLNSQKFININIGNQKLRFYCSGDVVKRLIDGQIQFLGRIDNQIKINGNRIELSEIESAIRQTGLVKECLVLPNENLAGQKVIIAYVVKKMEFEKEHIQRMISEMLPAFMLPNTFIVLDKIPLTNNNKADLMSLKKMVSAQANFIASDEGRQSIIETKLIELWKRVLGEDQISVNDNFFSLGGNSLLLIKLAFLINDEFGLSLISSDLFPNLTIVSMAELISNNMQDSDSATSRALPSHTDREATPSQQLLFYQNRLNRNIPFPVTATTLEIEGNLDIDMLSKSVQSILNEEPELRKIFFSKRGKVYYEICEKIELKVKTIYCQSNNLNSEVENYTTCFNLSEPPLIELNVLLLPNGRRFLHVEISHVIADGDSLGIFVDKLCTRYGIRPNKNGTPMSLVHDFRRQGIIFRTTDIEFWDNIAKDQSYFTEVLINNKNLDSSCILGDLSALVLENKGKTFLQKNGLSRFQFLFSVYAVTVAKITGNKKFAILFPVSNRNRGNEMARLGLFSNLVFLPVSIDLSKTVFQFLKDTGQLISDVIYHSQYPFEEINKRLLENRGGAGNPLIYFFGYQFIRDNYQIGDAKLKMVLTTRSKENLRLSFSLFDKANKIDGRLTSNNSYYTESDLEIILENYRQLGERMINSALNETIQSLLEHIK